MARLRGASNSLSRIRYAPFGIIENPIALVLVIASSEHHESVDQAHLFDRVAGRGGQIGAFKTQRSSPRGALHTAADFLTAVLTHDDTQQRDSACSSRRM